MSVFQPLPRKKPNWHEYQPKIFQILHEGYHLALLRADIFAGLTVAVVALPLAMALAIASGVSPERGLYTAIIAGFLISLLGGSRFQIGGPTGAFVVVVYGIIAQYGYDGLVLATLMASIILVLSGIFRLGSLVRYVPQSVVTGFTAGIALIIFSSQVKDILGLTLPSVPADFIPKWHSYLTHLALLNPSAVWLYCGTLAVIILSRRFGPRAPVFLFGVIFGAMAVAMLHLPVDTIGSRFGGIPSHLPAFHLPVPFNDPSGLWLRIRQLWPSAVTIAFLAGIESLLSAVVADGMTGRRHRPNIELIAQGIANMASVCFGGIPATGAVARTVTNVRSGGRTPVAGMLHAVFLLVFMLLLAPLIVYIPLASLAAILSIVAWNMSELHRVRATMRAPVGDRICLIAAFLLTVLVDLTVAIEVGVVLAALIFMDRMARSVEVESGQHERILREELPKGVEMCEIHGPLFFGAAAKLAEVLDETAHSPDIFILMMRDVPLIDATGAAAIEGLVHTCHKAGTRILICGMTHSVEKTLRKMGIFAPENNILLLADATEMRIALSKLTQQDVSHG